MKEETQNKKTSKGAICFAIIAIILIIAVPLFYFCCCYNKDAPNGLTYRDANNADIYIDLSQEISLNLTYYVVPNKNINNLEITFKFQDENNRTLTSKIKNLGNVKKGVQYPIYISLIGEFSFSDLFKIHHSYAKVTAGRVSLN